MTQSEVNRISCKIIIQEGCHGWTGGRGGSPKRPVARLRDKSMNAARALWIATYGEIGDLHVLHNCDNDQCMNLSHLYSGTHQQNMIDREVRGRHHVDGYLKGERHPNAKLTDDEVSYLRHEVLQLGRPHQELAIEFDLSIGQVSRIVNGRRRA